MDAKTDFISQIKPEDKEIKPAFQEIGEREEPKNAASKDSILIPKMLGQDRLAKEKSVNQSGERRQLDPKKRKRLRLGLAVFVFFLLVNFLLLVNVIFRVQAFISSAIQLKSAVSSQDLQDIKLKLKESETSLKKLSSSYRLIAWMKVIPFFGSYVGDGDHALKAGAYGFELAQILLDIVEPYADLIGLSGASLSENGEKTAADRIEFIVKAIPDLLPEIEEIAGKMELVQKEVDMIKLTRYPVKLGKIKVRENLAKGVEFVDEVAFFIIKGKPLLEQTPYLLGFDQPRTYLVLFQNDKELRPTGGFMTAYSLMEVNKAKFEPVASDDIYHLDAMYKTSVKAPDPIIKYLKGPYLLNENLRLRDMNWSPDFAESMALFTKEAEKVGVEGIDGVIAVDTQVLVNLLEVLGTIGVPGFGDFSTEIIPECSCPQVIYELESFADVEGPVVWDPAGTGKIIYAPPHSDNRKKIIGPLMNSILANALGQPKEKLPALFKAGFKSLMEKNVLFYLFDEKTEEAVKGFGIGGAISDYDVDYLFINDANLGGRKSNLYVSQEVFQEIEVAKDGTIISSLTVTYKNPEKQDGWLNSILPNWVRIYVPKGSKLLDFNGVTDKQDPYQEFGKEVFAGFFELRPLGVAKVSLKYKLPFKLKKGEDYRLFIQKQPGKGAFIYHLKLGKKEEEVFLNTDKEIRLRI